MEQDRVQDFSKPWLPDWLERLHGLPAYDQAIGLWLAHQANEKGVVEHIDWDDLMAAANVSRTKAREALREGPLVRNGFLRRKTRQLGEAGAYMPTVYTLSIKPR